MDTVSTNNIPYLIHYMPQVPVLQIPKTKQISMLSIQSSIVYTYYSSVRKVLRTKICHDATYIQYSLSSYIINHHM